MKHPALTRVMAVVLIIACAAMLISGVFGLGEAQSEYKADMEEYDKLNERIATFKELSAKLDGEDSYKETKEKLDERQEQHDKDASDYRTDLAERTATQGGYKQGADALWEAKAELSTAELQYNVALEQFQAAEAEYNAKMAQLDATLGGISAAIAGLNTPIPTVRDNPGEPGAKPERAEGQSEEDYNRQLAEYEKKVSDYSAYQDELKAKGQAEYIVSQSLSAANIILGQMNVPTVEDAAAAVAALGAVSQQLTEAKAAAQQQFEAGKKQIEEAGAKLDGAKSTIQGNLEMIWYMMGEMDDEEPELAENKQKLLDEAEQLEADKKAADEKKEDERKLSSTRAALKNYDGVAALLTESDDLAACAESYSDSFFAELNQNRTLRLIIAALEVVGGALGFLCLAPAYEKSKSRFMLLAPAAASLLLAAAALCTALYFGFGMNYAALPVLIFAPVYLLTAAPKNKLPAEAKTEASEPAPAQ